MLYFVCIVLLTFVSTFMAADTVAHVWQALDKNRVALISYGLWMAAFFMSVVDTDWLSTLGFFHALFFVACWLFVPQRNAQHSDYVRIPLTIYVPAYLVLYLVQGWLL